jgi:hypothetical protein
LAGQITNADHLRIRPFCARTLSLSPLLPRAGDDLRDSRLLVAGVGSLVTGLTSGVYSNSIAGPTCITLQSVFNISSETIFASPSHN